MYNARITVFERFLSLKSFSLALNAYEIVLPCILQDTHGYAEPLVSAMAIQISYALRSVMRAMEKALKTSLVANNRSIGSHHRLPSTMWSTMMMIIYRAVN